MAYLMAVIPMTLSDLHFIHLLQAFSNVVLPYSCATVDKISTDIARRAVPLR